MDRCHAMGHGALKEFGHRTDQPWGLSMGLEGRWKLDGTLRVSRVDKNCEQLERRGSRLCGALTETR